MSGTSTGTSSSLTVRGEVIFPSGVSVDYSRFVVGVPAAEGESEETQLGADGSFMKQAAADTSDFVMLLDENGNPVLLKIDPGLGISPDADPQFEIQADEYSIEISPKSTALALVVLHPILANPSSQFLREVENRIKDLPEINTLAEYIESKIVANQTSVIDKNDERLLLLIIDAQRAALERLGLTAEALNQQQ